jgi:hypothetical protein
MRQRNNSLSSDPDLMYENRITAVDLLAKQYPRLQKYIDERRRLEKYDYARTLMFNDRLSESRRLFRELLIADQYLRAGAMLGISFLPINHHRVVRQLDEIRNLLISE